MGAWITNGQWRVRGFRGQENRENGVGGSGEPLPTRRELWGLWLSVIRRMTAMFAGHVGSRSPVTQACHYGADGGGQGGEE